MRHTTPRPDFAGSTAHEKATLIFFYRPIQISLRIAVALVCLSGFAASVRAQDVFKPPPPVTYTEKYEAYLGASFLNGQAGQNLPKRINMGGGEAMATYYVAPRIGPAVDFRYEWGTTPVLPNSNNIPTRPVVYQTIGMVGAQYRGYRTQRFAINYHAFAGVSALKTTNDLNGVPPAQVGLYTNRVKPMATVGGSIDINRSARLAIRIAPDMVFEHFGNETREFFSMSGGVIYRFGHR